MMAVAAAKRLRSFSPSIMIDSITAKAAGVRSLQAAIKSNSSGVRFGRPFGLPDWPALNAVLGAFLSVFCLLADFAVCSVAMISLALPYAYAHGFAAHPAAHNASHHQCESR